MTSSSDDDRVSPRRLEPALRVAVALAPVALVAVVVANEAHGALKSVATAIGALLVAFVMFVGWRASRRHR